ncbi:hypothetical protein B0H10DRAFT_655781 [Mycena sp. CBHHK59/15]|nr:hypothetical protein B0H10DRAFT_655781 [Mycena sp. CBHHK59/15]
MRTGIFELPTHPSLLRGVCYHYTKSSLFVFLMIVNIWAHFRVSDRQRSQTEAPSLYLLAHRIGCTEVDAQVCSPIIFRLRNIQKHSGFQPANEPNLGNCACGRRTQIHAFIVLLNFTFSNPSRRRACTARYHGGPLAGNIHKRVDEHQLKTRATKTRISAARKQVAYVPRYHSALVLHRESMIFFYRCDPHFASTRNGLH